MTVKQTGKTQCKKQKLKNQKHRCVACRTGRVLRVEAKRKERTQVQGKNQKKAEYEEASIWKGKKALLERG